MRQWQRCEVSLRREKRISGFYIDAVGDVGCGGREEKVEERREEGREEGKFWRRKGVGYVGREGGMVK